MKKFKLFSNPRVKGAKKFTTRTYLDWYKCREWRILRLKFLKVNPNCYVCGRDSEVVDHYKAHQGDLELFWDGLNYIPLCVICHNTVTAKFDRFKPAKYEEKTKWIFMMRARNSISVRVKPVTVVRPRDS